MCMARRGTMMRATARAKGRFDRSRGALSNSMSGASWRCAWAERRTRPSSIRPTRPERRFRSSWEPRERGSWGSPRRNGRGTNVTGYGGNIVLRKSVVGGNTDSAVVISSGYKGSVDLGNSTDTGNSVLNALDGGNRNAICNQSSVLIAARGNTFRTCPPSDAGTVCGAGADVGGSGDGGVDTTGCR